MSRLQLTADATSAFHTPVADGVPHIVGKSPRCSSGHPRHIVGNRTGATLTKVALQVEHPIRNGWRHPLREHAGPQIGRGQTHVTNDSP